MTTVGPTAPRVPSRAWRALWLSTGGQTASNLLQSAPAFLVPEAVRGLNMSLPAAGMLAVAPTLGGALTLILWGTVADRCNNRWVFSGGLALACAALAMATSAGSGIELTFWIALAGMAAASANASSGRMIIAWFPVQRRGMAMGVRQMSAPLGGFLAAATVPVLVQVGGIDAALLSPLVACATFAIGIGLLLRDPPHHAATTASAPTTNPYRESSFLMRVHLASTLAAIPQIVMTTFAVAWLVLDLGWRTVDAGVLVGAAQLVAGLMRVVVGSWSDRFGDRIKLMRIVLGFGTLTLVVLALGSLASPLLIAPGIVLTTISTQLPNGLAFTSVAEHAGPVWSGRALGLQNTGQFSIGTVVGPLGGAVIAWIGYGACVGLTAAFSALAVVVTPLEQEHRD